MAGVEQRQRRCQVYGLRASPVVRIMAENLRERQIIAERGAQRSDLWRGIHAKRWDGGDPTL